MIWETIIYRPPFIHSYHLGWLWDKMVHEVLLGEEPDRETVEMFEDFATRDIGAVKCTESHWWYEDREGETHWVGPCSRCGADT